MYKISLSISSLHFNHLNSSWNQKDFLNVVTCSPILSFLFLLFYLISIKDLWNIFLNLETEIILNVYAVSSVYQNHKTPSLRARRGSKWIPDNTLLVWNQTAWVWIWLLHLPTEWLQANYLIPLCLCPHPIMEILLISIS